jgi:hypothetical protein
MGDYSHFPRQILYILPVIYFFRHVDPQVDPSVGISLSSSGTNVVEAKYMGG